MANGTDNGTVAKKELVSIHITAHPEYNGPTIKSDKRYGDKIHKFSITVPAPRTDDECQEIYGCTLEKVIEAGYAQLWYGARNVDNVIDESFTNGKDPNSEEVIDLITNAAFEQQFSAKERTSQSKEMKELKGVLSGLKMTAAQAAEYLRNMPK